MLFRSRRSARIARDRRRKPAEYRDDKRHRHEPPCSDRGPRRPYAVERETSDESLESFAVRRLGREAFERLIQPLISGIYTADPSRLSMEAALPQFVEIERKYGSVTRAMRATPQQQAGRQEGGARYGLFVAPRDGIGAMIEALVQRLPTDSIRLNTSVSGLSRNERGQWLLRGDAPHQSQEVERRAAIGLGTQVVRLDHRRLLRVRTTRGRCSRSSGR